MCMRFCARAIGLHGTGELDAGAEPLVIDAAFLDNLVNQMEEVRSTITSEKAYANLEDQDQQQRSLRGWLDTQAE